MFDSPTKTTTMAVTNDCGVRCRRTRNLNLNEVERPIFLKKRHAKTGDDPRH